MNNLLLHESFITEALAWALIHSLWQGLLVGGIIWTILKNISPQRPGLRYTVLHSGLIVMLGWFMFTFWSHYSLGSKDDVSGVLPMIQANPGLIILGDSEVTVTGFWSSLTSGIEPFLGTFFILWLSGVILFTLRLFSGVFQLKRLRTKMLNPIEVSFQRQIQILLARMDIPRKVEIMYSGLVKVPMVLGHFKPLILLPFGFFSGLSHQQVEAILIHELTHIKRNDYLINLMRAVIEIIFFYHPVYWWISNHIQLERENCCDDVSVSVCSPVDYAKALAILEERKISTSGLSLAASGKESHLFCRIKRLLTPQKKKTNMRSKIIFAVVMLIGIGLMSFNPINGKEESNPNTMETPLDRGEAFVINVMDTIPPVDPKVAPSVLDVPSLPSPPEPVLEPTPPSPPVAPVPPKPIIAPTPPSAPLKKDGMKTSVIVNYSGTNPEFKFGPSPTFAISHNFEMDAPTYEFAFNNAGFLDTIPPEKIEEMERRFEERINQLEEQISEKVEIKMKEFELNEEKIEKLAEEWAGKLELNLEGLGEEISKLFSEESFNFNEFENFGEEFSNLFSEENFKELESLSKELEESMEGLEDIISKETESLMEELEEEVKLFEERFEERFENMRKDLESEMLKDGFIKSKDEEINITTKDGEIRINGKKLSGQQAEKYRKILEKYINISDGKNTFSL